MEKMSLFNNTEGCGLLESVDSLCKTIVPGTKVIVFDTETSGLRNDLHVVLSLSWQVVDGCSWEPIKEETCFFPFPLESNRVATQAIMVNGLTPEFLEGKTISRKEGFERFAADLADVQIVIAHNSAFDIGFIDAGIAEEGMEPIQWPLTFDSMTSTVEMCGLVNRYGGPKNPRLSELAGFLGINSSDIHLHHSSGDVELTRRCIKQLVSNHYTNKE